MNKWERDRWKLTLRLFPRRVLCVLRLGHRYLTSNPVITDGPLDLPPRERDWAVLAYHTQCERCYKVKSVSYYFTDAETAVREAIAAEEEAIAADIAADIAAEEEVYDET